MSAAASCCVTGPNMAGKSTFLRYVAIATILAQVGLVRAGHVRAHRNRRPRLHPGGAQDDLAAGQSTFMVEMVETAQHPPPRHGQEPGDPGRGRAGDEHLRWRAVAQAVLEYIHGSATALPHAVRHALP